MGKRAGSAPVIPPVLEPVVAAFARRKGVTVEKGWGSSSVAFKIGGKIFAMLIDGSLVLKLSRERVDELVEDAAGTRFDPRCNGKVMKEWIVVPDRKRWLPLAREAHEFVGQ